MALRQADKGIAAQWAEIGRVLRSGGGVALLRNDWPAVQQAPSWRPQKALMLARLLT